jgi:acetylglutamate kinase
LKEKIQQAKVLLDALPYIKKFRNKIFVIKYGGSAQLNSELKDRFARDITLLQLVGIKPVIVHGGGNKISSTLNKMQIQSEFVDGLRVTTEEIMEVVEMVLSGSINKEITNLLNNHGVKAIGISGKDSSFIKAEPIDQEKWGYVGDIQKVDKDVILRLLDENFIPVIAPIAASYEDNHIGFNINADLAASAIAASLKADKVIFLSDIKGVLDKDGNCLTTLREEDIDRLKSDGTISGGMIPKVDACMECVKSGVGKAHIIDGRIEHSILLEVFTSDGIGTVIKE